MNFLDDEHKAFYGRMIEKTHTESDPYRAAMFYTLGLSSTTRNNIRAIYNFAEQCPRFDCLRKPWQTSTSVRLTRLAFNLYNGYDGSRSDLHTRYTPYELFCDGLMEYMFEAIRIRYPEYTLAGQEKARQFMSKVVGREFQIGSE